jgi:hypothetical protein
MFYIHVDDMSTVFLEKVRGPYPEEEARNDLLKNGWTDVTRLYGYCSTFVKDEGVKSLRATIRLLRRLGG